MGDKSRIEWTDATWNPITGCSKVSPGCAHCYAETLALTRMRGRDGYPGLPWTPENAAANVTLRPERLDQPLRWRRPRRIFVNSLSDVFHELVPGGFIARMWDVMGRSPQHTFQILTKRPERMREWVTRWADTSGDAAVEFGRERGPEATRARFSSGRARLFADMLDQMGSPPPDAAYPTYDWMEGWKYWPRVLPNVWLGTSVENQHWADVRIPQLLATPAAVRFLSMEPLLGPVDLERWLKADCPTCDGDGWTTGMDHDPSCDGRCRNCPIQTQEQCPPRVPVKALDWLIVGGESGPVHRAIDPEWVRAIRDHATSAEIPFLFKQWGGRTSKAGGRELDGRTWDEYPA